MRKESVIINHKIVYILCTVQSLFTIKAKKKQKNNNNNNNNPPPKKKEKKKRKENCLEKIIKKDSADTIIYISYIMIYGIPLYQALCDFSCREKLDPQSGVYMWLNRI